jgi:hypothetical protein
MIEKNDTYCGHVDQPMSASGDCIWCRFEKLKTQLAAVKDICIRFNASEIDDVDALTQILRLMT